MSHDVFYVTTPEPDSAMVAIANLLGMVTRDDRFQLTYADWLIRAFVSGAFLLPSDTIETVQSLVRDELGLPYPWVEELLGFLFRRAAFANAKGVGWRMQCRATPRPPGRRGLQATGAHIAKGVEWFYRVEISRRAAIVDVVDEYVTAEDRKMTEHPRSGVSNRIARAKAILAGISVADRPPDANCPGVAIEFIELGPDPAPRASFVKDGIAIAATE